MNILLPTTITQGMITAGSNIPVIDADAGEVGWEPSGTYAIDDLRVDAGAIYSCVKAHTATAQSKTPAQDPVNWLYKQPSNRMAPFDEYISTAAKRPGEVRYVLHPGFITGFAIYGAEADVIETTLRESAGGTVLMHDLQEMWEQAFGEWEYLFSNLRREAKLTRKGLPMRPAAELEISLRRNNPDVDAELGLLTVGQWRTLFAPLSTHGGTQYGAEVSPKSYSYFKRNDDGTYTRRKGRQAKQITASVVIDAAQAPAVEDLLRRVMDIPVAIEVSDLAKYGHISTVGFVTGSVNSETWSTARVNIKVDGNV